MRIHIHFVRSNTPLPGSPTISSNAETVRNALRILDRVGPDTRRDAGNLNIIIRSMRIIVNQELLSTETDGSGASPGQFLSGGLSVFFTSARTSFSVFQGPETHSHGVYGPRALWTHLAPCVARATCTGGPEVTQPSRNGNTRILRTSPKAFSKYVVSTNQHAQFRRPLRRRLKTKATRNLSSEPTIAKFLP